MTFETNIVELKKFLCANEIRSEMLKYTLKISWSLITAKKCVQCAIFFPANSCLFVETQRSVVAGHRHNKWLVSEVLSEVFNWSLSFFQAFLDCLITEKFLIRKINLSRYFQIKLLFPWFVSFALYILCFFFAQNVSVFLGICVLEFSLFQHIPFVTCNSFNSFVP